jgi:hypothetical protein
MISATAPEFAGDDTLARRRSVRRCPIAIVLAAAGMTMLACGNDSDPTDPADIPRIVVGRDLVSLNGTAGWADPPPDTITISGPNGPVISLTAAVAHEGPIGWLAVELEAATTPTNLILQANLKGLTEGTHSARVYVASGTTPSARDSVMVTLVLAPPPDTRTLADLINDYRETRGLTRIPLSRSLTSVAEAHVIDLEENSPHGGSCNMHSWSDRGPWTPCCYTSDHAQAQCMWDKPAEISNRVYPGYGFEIAAGGSGSMTAAQALDAWKGSAPHHAVIVNEAVWANYTWRALGAAVYGRYAVAWFGRETDPAGPP